MQSSVFIATGFNSKIRQTPWIHTLYFRCQDHDAEKILKTIRTISVTGWLRYSFGTDGREPSLIDWMLYRVTKAEKVMTVINFWIDCLFEILAFVAGSLQGHWWGFISRNYVVWPIFFFYECFHCPYRNSFFIVFVEVLWYWQFRIELSSFYEL